MGFGDCLFKNGLFMELHILVLNWNGEKFLKNWFDSLTRTTEDLLGFDDKTRIATSKLWVADNGSKDGSVKLLNEFNTYDGFQPEVNVVEIGHNRNSFAEGMNNLFEKANPADDDILLLLNNDAMFKESDTLRKMIALMNKTKAGVVGLRLLYPDTNKLAHAGVIFSERYNRLPYHYRPGEKTDKNAAKNRYFQAVTAAVCLVKASSFKRVGGFDCGFKWSFDDIDLCFKIGQNEKIAYCGESYAFHAESQSLRINPVNKLWVNSNVSLFRKKWDGKYEIDHEKYLKNPDYNVIK